MAGHVGGMPAGGDDPRVTTARAQRAPERVPAIRPAESLTRPPAKGGARTASQRERDRFVGFAFAAADLLIETDLQGRILFTAGARCRLTRGEVGSLVGKSLDELVAPSDRRYLHVLLQRIVEKTRIKPARVLFQGIDGHRFPALLGGCRLESCPGSLFLTVLLSGVPRSPPHAGARDGAPLLEERAFLKILEDRIVSARERDQDHELTLLLVEGLSAMLDAMPQGAAEEVREGIGAYLRGISADGDSAGQLSPDRFGVVHAPDIDSEEVRSHISEIIQDAGGAIETDGIRAWALDIHEPDLDAADAARALVYTVQAFASAQGGDFTINSLQDGARSMMSDAVERIARLRATIEKREFQVVYQPIVNLSSEQVHHLEALTRVDGMPSPLDFITFAEDVGLIYDFDLLLCQSVLDTLKTYRKEPKLPDVAINLSAKTLMSPLFLEQFQTIVDAYGELSRKLLIEVTETVVVTDIGRLNTVLQRLRHGGFRVCLDDVGSGATTFQSIYGLQVDFAKIDGRFVRGAVSSERDMSMLRSMVEACRSLGLTLIGEQVEEPDHAQLLMELEVPLAQGYLYGRPSRDFAYFAKHWSKTGKVGGTLIKK